MRPKYLLENRECFLPCGRKTVVAKGVGGNMKQTEKFPQKLPEASLP